MNTKQQVALLAGIVLAFAVGLFPPWEGVLRLERRSVQRPLGHYLIIRPPTIEHAAGKYPGFGYGSRRYVEIRLDAGRLLVNWVLVILLTGGLIMVLQDRALIWVKKKVRRRAIDGTNE
jgi:hypothetical protein